MPLTPLKYAITERCHCDCEDQSQAEDGEYLFHLFCHFAFLLFSLSVFTLSVCISCANV